jgi:hypothetical protein
MRTTLIIAALCVFHSFQPHDANADIIIDDFDDPASVIAPEMENAFITTLDVGPLNATRRVRIGAAAADPDARIDIGSTVFHAQVGDLHPTNPPVRPSVAAQLFYTFEPTDLTSGNAFFVDFRSVSGSVPPDFLRIIVFDDQVGLSFVESFFPIPLGGSFSAVLPFSEFVLRDGSPWPVHFNSINEITIGLHAIRSLDNQATHSWTAQIDRIRVGIVPEPDGVFSFFVALLWRRRRKCCSV